MFEYALVMKRRKQNWGEPETLLEVFYDLLSEMTAYLEERGYRIEMKMEKDSRRIRVNQEYINRIMDNLVSNIVKSYL